MRLNYIAFFAFFVFMGLTSCSKENLSDEEANRDGDSFDDVPGAYILTPATQTASTLPGYGQSSDPFRIRNAAELKYFVQAVNDGSLHPFAIDPVDENDKESQEQRSVYVELAHDIEVSPDYSWTPIGTFANPCEVYFNGKGYKIKGTLMHRDISLENGDSRSRSYSDNMARHGFFGYIYTADIRELTIEADITADKFARCLSVGGIAAAADDSRLTDCRFTGTIKTPANASVEKLYVGGLIGYSSLPKVTNSISDGTFDFSASLTTSDRTVNARNLYVGGLAGYSFMPGFTGCTNRTAISLDHITTARAGIGGLFGRIEDDAEIMETHNEADIKISNVRRYISDESDQGLCVGGIAGEGYFQQSIGKTSNKGEISVKSTGLHAFVGEAGGRIRVNSAGGGVIDIVNEGDVVNLSPSGYTGGCLGLYQGEAFSAINRGNVRSECTGSEVLRDSGSTGGIVGYADQYDTRSIANARNFGDITSPAPYDTDHGPQSYAGAIVGNAHPVLVNDCDNAGKVNGMSPDAPISWVGALWFGWQRLIDGVYEYDSEEGWYWREQIKKLISY